MAIPGFFKQNKPRGFNYVPRYYDPVKEDLEERRRAHKEQSDAVPQKREGTEQTRSEATQSRESGRAQGAGQGAQGAGRGAQSAVYRSRIMRGDMKNHFQRRTERVQKYTLIRIIVIAMIMILVIYLYLRF